MKNIRFPAVQIIAAIIIFFIFSYNTATAGFERVQYNNPGLTVDLGVGLWAWPLPMDYDGDGDNDLLISCTDVPYNGIYFFENRSGNIPLPVFEAPVRIADGIKNVQISYIADSTHILSPATAYRDIARFAFKKSSTIYPQEKLIEGRIRANQWKYCDYENDGDLDLLVGVGYWDDYGWDNAFDPQGNWLRGPLHGYVYLIRNMGAAGFAVPEKLMAGGTPVDVYGMPSPNLADFDGDGDLDLLCAEFVDSFTYFENSGSRSAPRFESGRKLMADGKVLRMDLQMIVPVAMDWDMDGDMDLIVGQEDGRVALLTNTGIVKDGLPRFDQPRFFRQKAQDLKFGALVTPVSFDWDADGDEDLICGNTAGYIGFIENLDGGTSPQWAEPVYLQAGGETIRIQAGTNGSIQGPCEAKWGYTVLNVADWDHDGLADLVVNSIWGKIIWFKNTGTREKPKLASAQMVHISSTAVLPKPAWNWWDPAAGELVSQWRTTPLVTDWNNDDLNDLVMLDHEGYLAFFQRSGAAVLPGQRLFDASGPSGFDGRQRVQNPQGGLLQLNTKTAGGSGRRKFCLVDWDRDGNIDLLVNSQNINFMRGSAEDGKRYMFTDMGMVDDRILAGHTTCPTTVDWDKNGIPDLLVGAEDGCFYYLKNPNIPE